jgi:radical SAM-linked protein
MRRAGIKLAYSEGFNPHPKISLAAPLAMGVTSQAELMDIYISNFISRQLFADYVGCQLPLGIDMIQVHHIATTLPSLQAQMRFAEYMVEAETAEGESYISQQISSLLEKEELPWQHQRDTGPHKYDLRQLIEEVWLESWRDGCTSIGMRLRCSSKGSGRPEQVIKALGLNIPRSIHRTRLILGTS